MKSLLLLTFFITLPSWALPVRNNVEKIINYQTSVKSQKSRGTCTIFSTIGLVESLLRKHNISETPDLSEEYLEYIVMTRQFDEGSTVNRNIKKLRFFGLPDEEKWPYLGVRWKTVNDSALSKERCGHLEGKDDSEYPEVPMSSCLLGHRDATLLRASDSEVEERDFEFFTIRENARENKELLFKNFLKKQSTYRIDSMDKAKEFLSKDVPLIMGLKLFYGAWNHQKTDRFEIQPRVKKIWYQGIVGYPTPGSIDRRISGEKGGGHSIILVGYDDEKIIKNRMLMEDGTWKETKLKGVFYFKNSWGVRGSGRDFELNGKSYPGYGMISQKYAAEFGKFYQLPVRKN